MNCLKKIYLLFLVAVMISCGDDSAPENPNPEPVSIIPTEGFESPLSYDGMTLVWADEFEGSIINEDDWTFELGTGRNGWGNFEAQAYRQENATFLDGNLVIEAKRESFSGSDYTSTRIKTEGKQVLC